MWNLIFQRHIQWEMLLLTTTTTAATTTTNNNNNKNFGNINNEHLYEYVP